METLRGVSHDDLDVPRHPCHNELSIDVEALDEQSRWGDGADDERRRPQRRVVELLDDRCMPGASSLAKIAGMAVVDTAWSCLNVSLSELTISSRELTRAVSPELSKGERSTNPRTTPWRST